ncbi:hypothetical protein H2198_005074 [Neophaeococcomyces mojaviensis]|uniref:Uncharacterized protein n=1 Tax=Neophaeococcomyces mojaviensis TaxID=3383035 RepID=A0ACC3A6M6_9EURO|nr:hypothetical protein H2198_005074 [Knufia sp. JES_112]
MAPITINGNTLDTERDRQTLLDLGIDQSDAAQSKYILVQGHSALDRDQKLEIEALGPKILQYVSDGTYLCRYEDDGIQDIENKDFVKWVNIYPDAFVVPPSLKGTEPPPAANGLEALTPPLATDRQRDFILTLHTDVDASSSAVRNKVAEVAHLDVGAVKGAYGQIRLRTEERYLDAMAKIDEVYFIEEEQPARLCNDVARTCIGAHAASISIGSAMTAHTLTGEGEIIAVADTGFDKGSKDDVHLAFVDKLSTTNPKKSRVLNLYGVGRDSKATDDLDGHGTHVCGSVLGSQTFEDNFVIEGTAPKAHLVVQSIFKEFGARGTKHEGRASLNPGNLYNLFKDPYDKDKARIHTNSWGSEQMGQYNALSATIDKFAYDHPEMVILFAAGNDGVPDPNERGRNIDGQIGSQPWAKNCITVGASENYRPDFTGTYGELINGNFADPIKTDRIADKPDGMASFSSRGFKTAPIQARVKPDVIAPGTCILSSKSRAISSEAKTLTNTINVNRYGAAPQQGYYKECGTSMATPLVAGCCAQIHEALRRNRDTGQIDQNIKPSGALVKAILINGAHELKGQYKYPVQGSPGKYVTEAGPSPNFSSGWGKVWLPSALLATAGTRGYPSADFSENAYQGHIDNRTGLQESENQNHTIRIPDVTHSDTVSKSAWDGHKWAQTKKSLQPTLKVTLVWADPPGVPSSFNSETLQNHLRLAVKVGNREKHGNRNDSSWDDHNNVQQVVWERIPAGQATLEISTGHFARTNAKQQFAVVWCLLVDKEEST